MPSSNFHGLRVLAFESRRAKEMATLVENYGGLASTAPAMQEVPLESNQEALAFASALARGEFDVVLFLTGVGARVLLNIVETTMPREQFLEALRRLKVVVRGPKPMAVLREWQVPVALSAPEPNTWRELLHALDEAAERLPLGGLRIAVQEYGVSNPELLTGLSARGAVVTRVPVYQWALPKDLGPLRQAITAIAENQVDIILFTTGVQVDHVLHVAGEMKLEAALRHGLRQMVIASIGPTTTEALNRHGLAPDMEPSHPKMGFLVKEVADRAAGILLAKRESGREVET